MKFPQLILPVLLTITSAYAQIQGEAKAYLDKALDTLQQNFIHRDKVDWTRLRERVNAAAQNAKTPADTHAAIRLAFEIMGERHSRFVSPEENQLSRQGAGTSVGMRVLYPENIVATVFPNSPASKAGIQPGDVVLSINNAPPQPNPPANKFVIVNIPKYQIRFKRGDQVFEATLERARVFVNLAPRALRLGKVGYLELPNHTGGGQIEGVGLYGNIAQKAISEIDQNPACGWVVDLRRNSGGNMWPMLVGAGPILGEGVVGSFIAGTTKDNWVYKNGASTIEQDVAAELEGMQPYLVKSPKPPVAVLVSRITASSGEATQIAFIGRENTRFFGEPSNGIPTANRTYDLSDGAVLVLTVSYMADRNGKAYNEAIKPDQEVLMDWANFASDKDPVLKAAVEWLQTQAACK